MRDQLEALSLRIPFRTKLALVWVVITVVVVVLFMAADFDLEWMLDQFWFIASGLPWTIIICGLAILLAVVLALRALGCTPPRDPVIEEHLLPRVRELVADPAGCPAFAVLVEDLAPVLPPEDVREAAWPRPSDWTPRWGAPRVDCETLGATLWRRALGE